MNKLLNFEYNGITIPFAFTGNEVMINATEMIKLFPGEKDLRLEEVTKYSGISKSNV